MLNSLSDLEHARKLKTLKKQLQEIISNPYVTVAGEVVSNCAVYPLSDDDLNLISVKYNPGLKTYTVDIEASSEDDVLRIIELIRVMNR